MFITGKQEVVNSLEAKPELSLIPVALMKFWLWQAKGSGCTNTADHRKWKSSMDFYYPKAEGEEDWLEGKIKPVPCVFTASSLAKTSSDK